MKNHDLLISFLLLLVPYFASTQNIPIYDGNGLLFDYNCEIITSSPLRIGKIAYIFGDYANLIKAIQPYLKKGGFLLVGEEFWKIQPSEEYLKILGAKESESRYHHENIALPETLGMTYLYTVIASEDDWNKFEGIYFLEQELKGMRLEEVERQEYLKKVRLFRQGQFKYGRSTMGFGLYLFVKE